MNSTIIIYKDTRILPERVFKVDDIETYLTHFGKITINNFMYVKHQLNQTIKIIRDQIMLEMKGDNDWNYCKIQNVAVKEAESNGEIVYYFITDKKWISEDCVQLTLLMDTVNSFVGKTGYELSNKTKIIRQHEDRFTLKVPASAKYLSDIYSFEREIRTVLDNNKTIGTRFDLTNVSIGVGYTFEPFKSHDWLAFVYTRLLDPNRFYQCMFTPVGLGGEFDCSIYWLKGDNTLGDLICDVDITNFAVPLKLQLRYAQVGSDRFSEFSYEAYVDIYKGTTLIESVDIDPNNADKRKLVIVNNKAIGSGTNAVREVSTFQKTSSIPYTSDEFDGWYELGDLISLRGDVKSGTALIQPKIDMYSEGFNPALYGKDLQYLNDSINTSWYLIYANQNDPSDSLVNPVDCYLVPDDDVIICSNGNVNMTFSGFSYRESLSIETNMCLVYFSGQFQPNMTLTYDGQTYSFGSSFEFFLLQYFYNTDLSKWHLRLIRYSRDGVIMNTYDLKTFNDFMDIDSESFSLTNFLVAQWSDEAIANWYKVAKLPVLPTIRAVDFFLLDKYEEIDRTDAKIIKIIELPYIPTAYIRNGGTDVEDIPVIAGVYENWESVRVGTFVYHAMKLRKNATTLKSSFEFELDSENNPFEAMKPRSETFTLTAQRSMANESKLLHSDYYQVKFIYDSFGFIFNLELMDLSLTSLFEKDSISITYRATNTINSRFMFVFDDYICTGKELQDYNNIMNVARNNEMPIYNQQYINYLRASYNYDVKSKTRTEVMSFSMATLSLIGAIASFASSSATGAAGIAAGVGLATSAVAQYANAVSSTIQAENNFLAKQEQLKQQASSVYGSDDVDLMNEYAKNRIKIKLYEVSERMKKALFDLFFYTGYVHNTMGVPNTTSRCRFNFVQAEIVFVKTPNMPKEIIDDLMGKYKLGITFIHHFNNNWDMTQQYENWETSLLGD